MENTNVIYLVEEKSNTFEAVSRILSAYSTTPFYCGQSLVQTLEEASPDVILIDLDLPDEEGFDICEQINSNSEFSHIPIIFLSSDNSLENRIKGYAAGGDDYICKPLEPEEMSVIVATAVKRKRLYDQARSEAKEASISALDIMNTLSEHSIVLHFMQSILNCVSYKQLADDLISSLGSLKLSIAIEFSVEDEREYFSTDHDESSLEISVFEYVRDKKHIVDVGKRCAFNYPTMSIIVRNMPFEDPELHGRLRDHVSVIGRAAESKLLSLRKDMAMYEQRNQLIDILTNLQTTVNSLETDYNQQQEESRGVFANVNIELERSFMALGLTDEQEDYLRELIDKSATTINEMFDSGVSLEHRFSTITDDIQQVLDSSTAQEIPPSEARESKTSDVDFF